MAIWETKAVVDANGNKTVEKAGPLSKVKMESSGNTTCITKEDVFGIHKRETCVTTPSTIVNNNNKGGEEAVYNSCYKQVQKKLKQKQNIYIKKRRKYSNWDLGLCKNLCKYDFVK